MGGVGGAVPGEPGCRFDGLAFTLRFFSLRGLSRLFAMLYLPMSSPPAAGRSYAICICRCYGPPPVSGVGAGPGRVVVDLEHRVTGLFDGHRQQAGGDAAARPEDNPGDAGGRPLG